LYWREKVANRQTNYNRNLKLLFSLPNSTQTQITDHYSSDQYLSKSVID
jgi:hypothetical protein